MPDFPSRESRLRRYVAGDLAPVEIEAGSLHVDSRGSVVAMRAPATIEKPDRSLPPEIDGVRTAAAECFAAHGVSLAVIHGSRARGEAHARSDLDVGVLATDGLPLSYSTMGLLALELSALIGQEVDVSDLATPDAIFRFEVARIARILFEARRGAFADFLAKALIDYSDIQRFLPELIAGVARRARRDVEASRKGHR